MVVKWVVFYADGHTRTSATDEWKYIPTHDAVIAVWWDENDIRHLECGDDSLVYTDEAIVGVNLPTLEFLATAQSEADCGILKYGVYMDPQAWTDLRQKAGDLEKFPE